MALLTKRKAFEATALLASTQVTADGQGSAVRLQSMVNAFAFTLIVSDANEDSGDTLDVYVQTKLDQTNWTDVVHFTQCTGSGGAVRHIGKVSASEPQAMFATSTALTAGAVRHLIGDEWRVRYDLTEGDSGSGSGSGVGLADFTIEVWACPM